MCEKRQAAFGDHARAVRVDAARCHAAMLGDEHDSHSTWLGGILDGVGDIIPWAAPVSAGVARSHYEAPLACGVLIGTKPASASDRRRAPAGVTCRPWPQGDPDLGQNAIRGRPLPVATTKVRRNFVRLRLWQPLCLARSLMRAWSVPARSASRVAWHECGLFGGGHRSSSVS